MAKKGQRVIPRAVRVSTAALTLELSRMQVDRFCDDGKLEGFVLDGVRFIWLDTLEELKEKRKLVGIARRASVRPVG